MPESTLVTLISAPFRPGQKEANLAVVDFLLAQQSSQRPDLVVFPEANLTGGFWKDGERDYQKLSEVVPSGPSCERVGKMARKHGVVVCCGIVEQDAGRLFVTHFLCGPDGYLGKQRKLFATKPGLAGPFSPGGELNLFQIRGRASVVLACADILLPEGSILPQLAGASLVISPVDAFNGEQDEFVRRVLSARAMDAQVPIVASFGHQEKNVGESLLAAMAVGANGEVLDAATRAVSQTVAIRVAIAAAPIQPVWGGFLARKEILAGLLGVGRQKPHR